MRIGVDASMLVGHKYGIGHYVASLLQEMAQLYPKTNFILYSHAPLEEFNCRENIESKWVWFPIGRLWMHLALPSKLAFSELDLFWGGNYAVPLLPRSLKKVITIHDFVYRMYPETQRSATVKHLKLMMPFYLKAADHVIAVSESTAVDLSRFYKYPVNKVSVISHAARNDFTGDVDKIKVETVLKSHNLDKGYILYVGTVEPRKGLDTLFEALAICCRQIDNCPPLVIVGSIGWKSAPILDLPEQLKIADKIFFKGYVPDAELPALYRGAQMFVYPSVYEGFGLPILEAMASGLPVITTTSSALPEVGGEAALYFDPGNADALAELIKRLLHEPRLREKLIEKGRNRSQIFTWQRAARQTMNIFCNVIKDS